MKNIPVQFGVYQHGDQNPVNHLSYVAVSKNGKLLAKVSGKADFRQEKDGEPQSKSKVDVDIPSKGIHRTILKDGGNVEVVDGQDFSNNGQRRSSIDNGVMSKIGVRSRINF